MLICSKCHTPNICDYVHPGFRSLGACEVCEKVKECIDCKEYAVRKKNNRCTVKKRVVRNNR